MEKSNLKLVFWLDQIDTRLLPGCFIVVLGMPACLCAESNDCEETAVFPGLVLVLMKEERLVARQSCAFVHLPCFPY